MCHVYQVVGTHDVRCHVNTGNKQCECPVVRERDGIAMILVPPDHDICKDVLNTPGLLQSLQRLMPGVRCFKLPES